MNKKEKIRQHIRIGGKRVSKVFSRKSDAELWIREMQRSKELHRAGLQPAINEISVNDFLILWLNTRQQNGKPLSSLEPEIRRCQKYIIPKIGNQLLHKVTTQDWDKILSNLSTEYNLKNATRNRIRSMLHTAYKDAQRHSHVVDNPIARIKPLHESIDSWCFWKSQEEITKYLEASKTLGATYYLYSMLSLNTGLRVGEIQALSKSDINLTARNISISKIYEKASGQIVNRVKGKRRRYVGLNNSLYKLLNEYFEKTKNKTESWILISDEYGKPLEPRKLSKLHIKACEIAGVINIRQHDLRHTFASHFMMNGGSLEDLRVLLGHSNPSMTLRYAHLKEGYIESKANTVNFDADDKLSENILMFQVRKNESGT